MVSQVRVHAGFTLALLHSRYGWKNISSRALEKYFGNYQEVCNLPGRRRLVIEWWPNEVHHKACTKQSRRAWECEVWHAMLSLEVFVLQTEFFFSRLSFLHTLRQETVCNSWYSRRPSSEALSGPERTQVARHRLESVDLAGRHRLESVDFDLGTMAMKATKL